MKIELLKPIKGKAYFEGDVIEVSDKEGAALIHSGHAILSKDTVMAAMKQVEAETAESPAKLTAETGAAVIKKGKRGRK